MPFAKGNTIARNRQHPSEQWALNAICLYWVNEFGIKRIAKRLNTTHASVRRVLILAGVYDPEYTNGVQKLREQMRGELAKQNRIKERQTRPPKPAPITREEYNQRQLARYYSHHDKYKSFGRKSARKIYQWARDNDRSKLIPSRLRNRLYHFIKGKNSETMSDLVACDWLVLIQWIESQFTNGMDWSNYGRWHIDHVTPCSAFDLTLLEQRRLCFHYTNLQPLWAHDNISKGGTNRIRLTIEKNVA